MWRDSREDRERGEGCRRREERREVGVAEKVNNHSLSSLICRLKGLICLLWVCVFAHVCVCVQKWVKLLRFFQTQPPDGSTCSQFTLIQVRINGSWSSVCSAALRQDAETELNLFFFLFLFSSFLFFPWCTGILGCEYCSGSRGVML